MRRLLLVEDDPSIVDHLTVFLQQEGFVVRAVPGERSAILLLTDWRPDLILLDLSLSDGSGFSVFRAARQLGIPAVFLTASDEESTVVQALDMGAEDFISKPFRPKELLSRIRSVLRRSGGGQAALSAGPLQVIPETASVLLDGRELNLSALEYRLLLRLIHKKGQLLTRDELLQELWDAGGDYVNDNTLSVYIKRLREKISTDPASPAYIQTVRGQGYCLGKKDEPAP